MKLPISVLRLLWPLAFVAFVLTPWIGVSTSWMIMGVLSFLTTVLSITWMVVTRNDLVGRVKPTFDGENTFYFFELKGDPAQLERQGEVVFEVCPARTYYENADFTPP